MRVFIALLFAFSLVACQTAPEEEVAEVPEQPKGDLHTCGEPRPEACPKNYDPVCAKVNVVCVTEPCPPLDETFSNGCVACSNELVSGYYRGACA